MSRSFNLVLAEEHLQLAELWQRIYASTGNRWMVSLVEHHVARVRAHHAAAGVPLREEGDR